MKSLVKLGILLSWTMALMAAFAATSPDVALTGVANLFGDKSAFFILNQAGATEPKSFTLFEGRSQFGIKLVTVDAVNGYVQIEVDGQIQKLRISSPPDQGQISRAVIAQNRQAAFSAAENLAVGNSNAADGRVTNAVGDATSDNLAEGEAESNSTKNSARANGSDPATSLKSQADSDWYQESLVIEQNRLETADAVLAGEMTPWPLTPLTPGATAGNLIGNDAMFANHIPGFFQH